MPPKPAIRTKPRTPAKTRPAEERDVSCSNCNYLWVLDNSLTNAQKREKCGQHTAAKEAAKVVPEVPESLPDSYRPFVDPWDGRVRGTVAAANIKVPPPQSPAWEHLIEWAADVRKDHPHLTVCAVALLLRTHMPADEGAVRRIHLIYADEYAAEQYVRRKKDDPPTAASLPDKEPPRPVVAQPAKPKDEPPPPPDEDAPPKITVKRQEGHDEWGYRLGTRSAAINAYLKKVKDWKTPLEVEKGSGATSASSHLSSLVAKGFAEYQNPPPGTRTGKYRVKQTKK